MSHEEHDARSRDAVIRNGCEVVAADNPREVAPDRPSVGGRENPRESHPPVCQACAAPRGRGKSKFRRVELCAKRNSQRDSRPGAMGRTVVAGKHGRAQAKGCQALVGENFRQP